MSRETHDDDIWQRCSGPMALDRNDVHVWRSLLQQPEWQVKCLLNLLSWEEIQRAERFHLDRDRTRFIVSHGVLRLILSNYADVEPNFLCFGAGPSGKPHLAATQAKGITFSMSHSGGAALYGFTRVRQIGVDVEQVRNIPEAAAILDDTFPPAERDLYHSTPDALQQTLFFRLWTSHEAQLKAEGKGLASSDSDIRPNASDWSTYQVDPFPGYIGAVAVQGRVRKVRFLEWTDTLAR